VVKWKTPNLDLDAHPFLRVNDGFLTALGERPRSRATSAPGVKPS
jgi:hypothetical protein